MRRLRPGLASLAGIVLALLLFIKLNACGDPSDIDCSQVYTGPVCGIDGNTYTNDCYAEQAGIGRYLSGSCPREPCSGPVCADGVTYPSDCFALLSGIPDGDWEDGSCPEG